MEGNLSKALWLGVTILLFIAVVTVGLPIRWNEGCKQYGKYSGRSYCSKYDRRRVSMYDGGGS